MILLCTYFVELELDQCRNSRPVFAHSPKILLGYLASAFVPTSKNIMAHVVLVVQIDLML